MDCKEILLFINISYIFGLLFENYFWLIIFQFNFESLFRSLHYALMDNCCREYLFLVDFYMASGTASQDLFNAIMSKTLQTYLVSIHKTDMHLLEFCTDVLKSMYLYYHTPFFTLQKTMEEHVSECYDSIAIFLSIHIVHRFRNIMHKRAVPALDR